jgi:hypothetical protein
MSAPKFPPPPLALSFRALPTPPRRRPWARANLGNPRNPGLFRKRRHKK